MKNKLIESNVPSRFFFCPASDYLNQHNETGSHGQISYQFLRHLAMKPSVRSIFAVVMMSLRVSPIPKTKIYIQINKKNATPSLNAFDSLYFYIMSFINYLRSSAYQRADVVHHIIPFRFGSSFNLFFFWKNKKKKYVIGPIFGAHVNDQISDDEEYVFIEKKSLKMRLSEWIFRIIKGISLGLFGGLLYQFSLKTLRNADVLFFSDAYSLNYHKKYIKNYQKAIVLDTGVDLTIFKPGSMKVEKKVSDLIRILFVGRFTKRKGCEYLIRALYEAKSQKPNIKIHCDILGFGPLEEKLKNLVKELRLTKDVSFLSGVRNEELVKHYHMTDIICIPALSDTCTVIKEALSSGKPVIVTDVCSHAEKVKNGINGFLVPPQDSKAIADVLLKISNNPGIINELSRNAPKTSYLYDWNYIIERYLAAIR
jgi:glycosyltransferase involved in cell wall biosynthesis